MNPEPASPPPSPSAPAEGEAAAPRAADEPTGVTRSGAFRLDRRMATLILITAVLLGAHVSFGILESYETILIAVAASIITEAALGRLVGSKRIGLGSGYMTGISVGILIRSPAFWPFAICSMISVTSKYVIRPKGRHIWNPSNFGICAMLFLAPFTVAPLSVQWGNNLWPMVAVWMLGLFTLWRFKLLHIAATYAASFFAFGFLRSTLTGDPFLAEIAPITGPMYQLFVFFMITDPRTSVSSKRGRVTVAFLIGLVEAVLRLAEVIYAPFYALFLVGPSAMLIDLWSKDKRTKVATAETS